jgi:hypothetical protein
MLKQFSMKGSNRGYLPISQRICLSKDICPNIQIERDRMERIPYALIIGLIMYAMLCRRNDVSYTLSITSKYQCNLGEGHWKIVKNIFKYLKELRMSF